MQTNWRKCSSRTIAHENALKRSLFVNYSLTVLMGAMQFWLQKSIRLLRPYLRFLAGKVSRQPTR